MNSGKRVLLALLAGLAAGACASGAGTTTTDPAPTANDETPARTFPPGTEPARNVWTRSAQIYLDQAEESDAADIKQAEYTQALAQARLSVQNEPNNPLGYYQAGIALIGLGQYEEADRMLDRAEELYPRYVLETGPRRQNAWVAVYNRSVQELQQNNEDEAVRLMRLADTIYQGRPEARVNLAVIHTNRGEYDSAIEWYEKALETLRSDDVQFLPRNVQQQFAEQETDIVFNMAQLYERTDRRAEAIRLYREYLAENPDDAGVKVQLAAALSAEGQEAEASALFAEVLNMQGLAEDEFYQVGIGLFNAGRFEDAATAFERAVAANPHFRDAIFNLSQALLAQANQLSDEDASDAELQPLYERMVTIGETLREIDPFNRTGALVLANAYRSMADMSTGATATNWRNRLVTLLETIEALPVDVSNISLSQTAPGRIQLSGALENRNLDAGTPVTLRFSLVGTNGAPLATQEVRVDAPAREESASFRTEFQVQGPIAGWRYERVQ